MVSSKLILLGLILGFLSSALGHSYLTSPTSRSNQKQSTTGCRGPACLGPCDVKASSAKTKAVTIARGASISLQWPRNNHAGGFIRVAWAQTSQSDSHASFDANVQQIFCHERGGCKPDSASNPNGGDSNPADGSRNPCAMTITVPTDLTDGTWTLQWAWFGGAFALGDYYSCVDYVISGGPTGASVAPFFTGGDYTYPGQNKCKFFNTDRLHQCVNEPCNNPVYSLNKEQSGPAYGVASGTASSGSTPVPTPSPAPTPTPTPATSTSTTGRSSTSTTGPKPSSTSTSGSSSGSNTLQCTTATFGFQQCTGTSSYRTCDRDRNGPAWSQSQNCQTGLKCTYSATGNNIYCV